jgi:hypothetical protein
VIAATIHVAVSAMARTQRDALKRRILDQRPHLVDELTS